MFCENTPTSTSAVFFACEQHKNKGLGKRGRGTPTSLIFEEVVEKAQADKNLCTKVFYLLAQRKYPDETKAIALLAKEFLVNSEMVKSCLVKVLKEPEDERLQQLLASYILGEDYQKLSEAFLVAVRKLLHDRKFAKTLFVQIAPDDPEAVWTNLKSAIIIAAVSGYVEDESFKELEEVLFSASEQVVLMVDGNISSRCIHQESDALILTVLGKETISGKGKPLNGSYTSMYFQLLQPPATIRCTLLDNEEYLRFVNNRYEYFTGVFNSFCQTFLSVGLLPKSFNGNISAITDKAFKTLVQEKDGQEFIENKMFDEFVLLIARQAVLTPTTIKMLAAYPNKVKVGESLQELIAQQEDNDLTGVYKQIFADTLRDSIARNIGVHGFANSFYRNVEGTLKMYISSSSS